MFRFRSMPTLSRFAASVVASLTLASAAHAHDPSESWTEVIVHADKIELLVTMAQANALRLIDALTKNAELTPENFAQHRTKLVAAGAKLFAITSLKQPLAAQRVDVVLTEENDVAYKIIFPRPAPGLLMFEAAFIKQLGDGFGGIIDASDTEGHHLGWEQLSPESATLVVMLSKLGEAPPKKS